ncbi:hypothetical protein N6H14_18175 [Paenibacillus sp. CC-CFT747]|nr:hypothetical protein N6H14_18175 [Paenibacillus sp. CC-CFT747]
MSIMRYGSSEIRHEHITRKMKNCDIVLVMCGLYSAYGETMREEMKVCKELGKPMIAIERYNEKLTSPLVKESADRVVPWNSRRIIRAIKELT